MTTHEQPIQIVPPIMPLDTALEKTGLDRELRAENILGLPVVSYRWPAYIWITPVQARAILKLQPSQRTISHVTIRSIVGMINNSAFRPISDALAFDQYGLLMNGQHRLMACDHADKPIEVLAVFNQPREWFRYLDSGNLRTPAQHLYSLNAVTHQKYGPTTYRAGEILYIFDHDGDPTRTPTAANSTIRMERAENAIGNHPLLFDTAKWCVENRDPVRITPGFLPAFAAFLTLFREVDKPMAKTFGEQMVFGENLQMYDPVHTFRKLPVEASTKESRSRFMHRMVHVWNAFRQGRQLKQIRCGEGKSAEDAAFPRISGYFYPSED